LEWTVSLFPTRLASQRPSSFVGGDLIGITQQSAHKDEAWELVAFLLSEDVQVEMFAANGVIPVRADFLRNEYFEREPRYLVFAEAVNVGRAPYTVAYNELYAPLVEHLDPAVRGQSPIPQALEQLARDIDIVLQEAAQH
ncbi:MAG TPA: extracellular solute-binding protein, partial [Limnochordia bacterium]